MRLHQSIVRWDSGMSNVEAMETKWEDAFHTVMAFAELWRIPTVEVEGGGWLGRANLTGLVLGCIDAKFCK